ncbi:MAG TPA: hypothetical protein VIA06_19790 [Candidatus Dormibacteraeota bacterium]|jgi:hypothetical protein|nr:hypothetical protein [Candidatus Dormibacteraeota bacterium]
MAQNFTVSNPRQSGSGAFSLLVGILLVGVGGLVLAAQHLSGVVSGAAHYGWPLFVIAPGLLLVAAGMGIRSLSGLCIPGSIVTITGLLLLVQNTFDLWSTWAYAWTLVVLVGTGAGLFLQGLVTGRGGRRQAGALIAGFGVVAFSVGAVLFEGLLDLSGLSLGPDTGLAIPFLLIAVGAALVAWPRSRLG